MSNILINYSILNNSTKENIEKIINGCYSKQHKITLNLYDFSLKKNVKKLITEITNDEYIKINVINKDFEDSNKFLEIILDSIIQYGDCIVFTAINDNCILKKDAIDSIDYKRFEEKIHGFTYFDYNVNNIRCYLKSVAANISIPIIFFSTQVIIDNLSEGKNTISHVLKNSISHHISKNLCDIYT